MPAEESEGGKPATTSGTRLVERKPAAEGTQSGQVLVQRVIALSGGVDVVDVADRPARQPVILAPLEGPPPTDLSTTSLEWGGRQIAAKAESAERPTPAFEPSDFVDAQWATHSSIKLELCDDAPLPQRLLSLSIEDAVTQQYNPNVATRASAVAATELELVTRDVRAAEPPPEPSRAPRVLVVPAAVAWTVAAAFSACALALAYLVTAFLACGHPSLLDPIGLRCVDRADVAKAR